MDALGLSPTSWPRARWCKDWRKHRSFSLIGEKFTLWNTECKNIQIQCNFAILWGLCNWSYIISLKKTENMEKKTKKSIDSLWSPVLEMAKQWKKRLEKKSSSRNFCSGNLKKKRKSVLVNKKNLDLVSSSVGNSSFKNEMKSYFKLKFENLKYIWQITQPISGWGE